MFDSDNPIPFSWALFYLNEPTMIFSNTAQYTFVDEKQTVGIDLSEKLLLKLSGVTKENSFHHSNWTSVICKVEVWIFLLHFTNTVKNWNFRFLKKANCLISSMETLFELSSPCMSDVHTWNIVVFYNLPDHFGLILRMLRNVPHQKQFKFFGSKINFYQNLINTQLTSCTWHIQNESICFLFSSVIKVNHVRNMQRFRNV